MTLEQIVDRVVESDVLVIGGGISGCPAATKATENGLSVTLIEKSKTDRSGNAGPGANYFIVGPRPHGDMTAREMVKRWEEGIMMRAVLGEGRFVNPNIMYKHWEKGWWAVEELEKLGVSMRWYDGEYRFCADSIRLRGNDVTLQVHWSNAKPKLAAAVREREVNVLERTMVVDLLTNKGKVVGATAVNTRTGEFIVIKAKAVVIAAGLLTRCFHQETPSPWKYKFNSFWCPPANAGDGLAIAYRAGAELVNMDLTGCVFRTRDILPFSFGWFRQGDGIPSKLLTWTGKELSTRARHEAKIYDALEQKGLTPLYHTLEHAADDFQKRIEISMNNLKLLTLKMAEDRGFNPRTHRYDAMPNIHHQFGIANGVDIDEDHVTRLKGVYIVGDCATGLHGNSHAVISGLLVGDSLSNYVSKAGEPVIDEAQVETQKQVALAPLAVKDGTEPLEMECTIRYICDRYVGQFKSEGKLREGLRRLGSLRRVFLPRLMAKNPHYLMRCLEVRNIMDMAELHINAALERKETRGNHIRLDYPERDSARDNMLTYQRLENGKPVMEIREVPGLKPEYAKEGK
jgi:succinate dehydrogenase/fumarate reductase flavoprotein subunit